MATLTLSNLFLKFLNLFFLVVPIVLIRQQDMEEYYTEQSALIGRNKEIFLYVIFAIASFCNGLLMYAKFEREKIESRIKKIDLEIKEIELKKIKDENI